MTPMTAGQALAPVTFEVTQHVVTELLQVLGVPGPVRAGADAPAGLHAIAALYLMESQHVIPPGSVHAEQEVDQLAPLRVGTTLHLGGVVGDVRERKGRRWVTVDGTAHDDEGTLLATTRTTVVLPPERVA